MKSRRDHVIVSLVSGIKRHLAIGATVGLLGLTLTAAPVSVAAPGLAAAVTRLSERVLTRWFPPKPPPQAPGISDFERGVWRVLGRHFTGRLLWSSNRNGNHDIYVVEVGSGAERRLTDHPTSTSSHVSLLTALASRFCAVSGRGFRTGMKRPGISTS